MSFLRRLLGLRSEAPPATAATVTVTATVGVGPEGTPLDAVYERRREATAMQRAGDTAGAVRALEEADRLSLDAGVEPSATDAIRRAKYLQKDGRSSEAWAILTGLLDARSSPWTDVEVLDAMRLHLQRDGQGERAIGYGVAHRVARIDLYRQMRADAEAALTGSMPVALASIGDPELDALVDGEAIRERIKANHRFSIELAEKWIRDLTDPDDLVKEAGRLSKKGGVPERASAVLSGMVAAIDGGAAARAILADFNSVDD